MLFYINFSYEYNDAILFDGKYLYLSLSAFAMIDLVKIISLLIMEVFSFEAKDLTS